MRTLDRLRIERAVIGYDLWLDLRGVPGRRRRELRRELRVNLHDAAQDVGVRRALDRIGGTRTMAAEAVESDPRRPSWSVALACTVAAFGLTVCGYLFSASAFADGVQASGVTTPVEGPITLLPGSSVTAQFPDGSGALSVEVVVGWAPLVVAAVVFLLAARPWRLLRRTGAGQPRTASR